jgi:hypothetical protein
MEEGLCKAEDTVAKLDKVIETHRVNTFAQKAELIAPTMAS